MYGCSDRPELIWILSEESPSGTENIEEEKLTNMQDGVELSSNSNFQSSFFPIAEGVQYECFIEDARERKRPHDVVVDLALKITNVDNPELVKQHTPYIKKVDEQGSSWHRFCVTLLGEDYVANHTIERKDFIGKIFFATFKKILVGEDKNIARYPINEICVDPDTQQYIRLSG